MAIQKSKEEILKSLEQIVDNIEQSIQKYMRSFETDISFSNNEELRKKHLSAYNKFLVILNARINECDKEISALSVLICNADTETENEITETLVMHFDNYAVFTRLVSQFIEACNSTFLDKEKRFSPAVILNFANLLLIETKKYKENI